MFTESDLRELLDFSAPEPVLSVYLNTEPSAGNADAYRLRLRNMLKDVRLPEDVEAIERYFTQEYNWAGRSVAVFSCQSQGFFRAYPLAIPVANMINVSDRPSVKPLTNLLDSYGGYGVVLVDQQGARLFHFHLGELTEQEGVLGENIKRVKRGGASSVHGRRGGLADKTRSVENTVERNMKEAAEFAEHFFQQKRVRRVLVCGTEDNVAMFRSNLPKTWQSLVVGCFHMSMTASHNEVLQRALQAGQEAENHRSQKDGRRSADGGGERESCCRRARKYTDCHQRQPGSNPGPGGWLSRIRLPLSHLSRLNDCQRGLQKLRN
jgi:peptide chain release factor subunit 1